MLTRDHVPPKSVTPARAIDIRRLVREESIVAQYSSPSRRGFQAPVFPSLCLDCNSHRLGRLYDPALKRFAEEFAVWARAATQHGLLLPKAAEVDLVPADVGRAVVGHLLAAEERTNPVAPLVDGAMLQEMRDYFLNGPESHPSFKLLVWPYVGTDIVIMRNFGIGQILGRTYGPTSGDLLKFFPFAFWVVSAIPNKIGFRYAEIPLHVEQQTRIEIPLLQLPHRRWPEMPGDGEVIFHNAERGHLISTHRRGAT